MNECVDLVLEAARLRDENAELRAEIERLTRENDALYDTLWRMRATLTKILDGRKALEDRK